MCWDVCVRALFVESKLFSSCYVIVSKSDVAFLFLVNDARSRMSDVFLLNINDWVCMICAVD